VQAGDTVPFGRWQQLTWREAEPVAWTVMEVRDRTALLLSLYGLESRPFSTVPADDWEHSSLRAWLNREFLERAFTPAERQAIVPGYVSYRPGRGTRDMVHLLCAEQAELYFRISAGGPCDPVARVMPTVSAVTQGAAMERDRFGGWWWLCSAADPAPGVLCIDASGAWKACLPTMNGGCVRPAVWVDLDAVGL
jgi:hypothetical protein